MLTGLSRKQRLCDLPENRRLLFNNIFLQSRSSREKTVVTKRKYDDEAQKARLLTSGVFLSARETGVHLLTKALLHSPLYRNATFA